MHPQEKGHTRLTSRKVCNAFCSLKLLVINDWRKAKGRSQRGILYTELASLLDVELFSGIQTQHDSHYLSHFDLTAHPGYAHLRRHQRLIDSVHGPRLPATCPATPASASLIRTYVGAYDSGCRLYYLPPVFGRRRAGEMVRSLWEEDVKKEKGRGPAWGLTGAVEVEREAHANSGQPKEAKLEELEMLVFQRPCGHRRRPSICAKSDLSEDAAWRQFIARSCRARTLREVVTVRARTPSSPFTDPAPRTKSNASSFAPAFGLVISASQLHCRPNQSSQQPATPRARALTSSGVNLVVIRGVEGKLLVLDVLLCPAVSAYAAAVRPASAIAAGGRRARWEACEEGCRGRGGTWHRPTEKTSEDERDECERYERQRERTRVSGREEGEEGAQSGFRQCGVTSLRHNACCPYLFPGFTAIYVDLAPGNSPDLIHLRRKSQYKKPARQETIS
ncbi:hypothetical protein DFH11DRAFT_1551370 [Phellopilus nigrolimitatus]|nr:hypothetical protein DFH11DRAFT_1551370 [Phellopilus nigrolimitatus]